MKMIYNKNKTNIFINDNNRLVKSMKIENNKYESYFPIDEINELIILKKLSKYDVFPDIYNYFITDDITINIEMTYYENAITLTDLVTNTDLLKQCIKNMLVALYYIHNENLIYGDFHSNNILYHEGLFKLIDFGLSKDITYLNEDSFHPSIFRQASKKFTQKCDLWALGCVIIFKMDNSIFYKNIKINKVRLPLSISECISIRYNSLSAIEENELKYYIDDLLTVNESYRLNVFELINKYNIKVDKNITVIKNKNIKTILDNQDTYNIIDLTLAYNFLYPYEPDIEEKINNEILKLYDSYENFIKKSINFI